MDHNAKRTKVLNVRRNPTYGTNDCFIGNFMNYHIEYEQEIDGRWLAEVPEIPGVLAYGVTANEAMAKAEILVLRVIADSIEAQEQQPMSINIELVAA